AASSAMDLLVVLLWLPAIEGGQKRNCRGFSGLGSTAPAAKHLWERLQPRGFALAPPLRRQGRPGGGAHGSMAPLLGTPWSRANSASPGPRRPAIGRGGPRSSLNRASCPDSRAGHPWPAWREARLSRPLG